VNHDEALKRAREFSDSLVSARRETSRREFRDELDRARRVPPGTILPQDTMEQFLKIYAKHIDNIVEARLDGLLEGYTRHGVPLTEQLGRDTLDEVMSFKNGLIRDLEKETVPDIQHITGGMTPAVFSGMVMEKCNVSRSSAKVKIQRQRWTPKKESAPMNITYQLIGHGSRVNVNSTDNSTNVVEISEDQVFSRIRHDITAGVPAGDEKDAILRKLTDLEKARNTISFGQRYAEFMGVAANHMTVLLPFLPALTAMAHQWR
jgi:hypothetical protein